jgi:FG-GAP-like repeat
MKANFFTPKSSSVRFTIVLVLVETYAYSQAVSFLAPTTEISHGTLPHRGIVPRGLAAADFNGDGKLDIVEIQQNQEFNFPIVSLGNGDGTFRPTPSPPASPPNLISDAVTADFDGDGRVDVASIYASSGVGSGSEETEK